MRVVVPFDAREPKTRLEPVLDDRERRAVADAMLADVLAALAGADRDLSPTVLATAAPDRDLDVPVTVDERPLTAAVNAALAAHATPDEPVAVVMADLPLATPRAVERLVDAAADADVVLVPGVGGGTTTLVSAYPDFRVDYHGVSYRDHRRAAADLGAAVATVDSFRLSQDVDVPADLAEVLLHSDGAAADWLREAGFAVAVTDGRVGVTRD